MYWLKGLSIKVLLPYSPRFTVAVLVLLGGCIAQSDERLLPFEDLPEVVALPLQLEDHYLVTRRLTGLVTPRQRTELGFELSGKLQNLAVKVGDTVRIGQPLATLNTELLQHRRDGLHAQAKSVQARLELVQLTQRRRQNLAGQGFSSAQELDDLRLQFQDLTAQLDQLAAELAANQAEINKSQLHAPFAGVITQRYRDTGAVVEAGSPIFRLLETDHWEAEIGLPPRLHAKVSLEREVALFWRNQPLVGRPIAFRRELDPHTRTATLRVALPNLPFIDGELIELTLEERIETPGFWLPLTALTEGVRGRWRVFVLESAAIPDNTARLSPRDVTLVYNTQNQVFVTGALQAHESILRGGLHKFSAHQQVRFTANASSLALGN